MLWLRTGQVDRELPRRFVQSGPSWIDPSREPFGGTVAGQLARKWSDGA